ncbi:MAG TPA: hypothetical protein VG456_06495 [Candidatus Sulfopaludibacter sp.]|jgi:hypothetical protein|nr:hypothetical protein [Candidatus Sulfopaludibacter sp.]
MRVCLCLLAIASLVSAATVAATLKGKLAVHENGPATIETADHHVVTLTADDTITKVLADPRLNGFEAEARGHFTAPDKFQIDPSHTIPFLIRKDGHLKMVTYWCDVCSIRDYTPGPCRCCQRETALDLRDPDGK